MAGKNSGKIAKASSKQTPTTRRFVKPRATAPKPVVTGGVVGGRYRVSAEKVSSGVEMLGTKTALAKYLGVAKTQPGRWIQGAEIPKPATARLVKDLDYVWDRIRTDMGQEAAEIWLRSPNGFLNGNTPLDWLRNHGPSEVIAAFDAAEAGSYV